MNAHACFRRSLAALLIAGSPCLDAAQIPTLFNTGVDANGALLGEDTVDPHYKIVESPDGNFPGPDAFTLVPGFPVGPWVAEGPISRWIAPQTSQATGNEPGRYSYQTTFDLTGFLPDTARITGLLATDDALEGVRLNGVGLTGITSRGFVEFNAFTIPVGSPFAAGLNTLEFDIGNGGTAANPTGFRVEMTGIATGTNERPSVITHPQSQTVVVGDLVIFEVEALGIAPLNYQWRFNGNPIAGANAATYTITGAQTTDAGQYRVTISNSVGEVESTEAQLTVLVPFPGIFNTGVGADRGLLADGAADPHYRLVLNANDAGSSDAIAQSAIPSPPWIPNSAKSRWIGPLEDPIAAGGNYTYQLVLDLAGYDPATAFLAGSWATDDGGSLFLNGADTGFRTAGFTTFSTFSITAGFVSGQNLLEFRLINGGINPTGLRVENLRGTAEARVLPDSPPRIVVQPQGATRVITESVTFAVVADGVRPLSYEWSRNGALLANETGPSLTISSITTAHAGAYQVRISNALGSETSNPAVLTVIEPPLGIFNTGVDNAGVAIPIGQSDPHYMLVLSPDATYPGPTTFATAGPIPPWVANDEDSQWISARPDGGANVAPGSYRYRLIFTIEASEVATAAITGNVGTDDGNGGVFLNGNDVEFGASGFGSLTPLEIPEGSPFVPGLNTLDFVPVNGGESANPGGLRVDDLVITGVALRPFVSISRSGTEVRLSWPASITGFVLQETSVVTGRWANSSATVTVEGSVNVAVIAPTSAATYYRLIKPAFISASPRRGGIRGR